MAFFRTRYDLGLEILALSQQVTVPKRKHPRSHLDNLDRLFWIALRRLWSRRADVLLVVKPETVVGWHHAGFRLYWRLRSRGGGRKVESEVFELVRRMERENPLWGAPRIHGELLKLGFDVSERTVSRYLAQRLPRSGDAARNWVTFLRRPPRGDRGKILHFNVTAHPTADWVVQQLRDAFPDPLRGIHVILDRDAKSSPEVLDFLDSPGIKPVRTSVRSPWQNGVAGRGVGSARREYFDHVIALDEAHLRRLAREYMTCYHADRTHDGLAKDTPSGRAIEVKPAGAELISLPRVGGLHHQYAWKVA